jgi:hypothetical protein
MKDISKWERNIWEGIRLRWQCNEELLGFKTRERDARFRLFWADFKKIGENRNPEKRWVKMSVPYHGFRALSHHHGEKARWTHNLFLN